MEDKYVEELVAITNRVASVVGKTIMKLTGGYIAYKAIQLDLNPDVFISSGGALALALAAWAPAHFLHSSFSRESNSGQQG